MNYAQLRAFHAVATTGSFTQAAKTLFISQPAVTQHIKELELTYDAELFFRSRRGAKLTQVGLELLAVTSELVALERRPRASWKKQRRNLKERCGLPRMGHFTASISSRDFEQGIRRFR